MRTSTMAGAWMAWVLGAVVLGAVSGCGLEAERAPVGGAAGAVSELVLPDEQTGPAIAEKHFVTNWMVLGPIQFKDTDFGGDQQQASAEHAFVKGEAALDGTQPPPAGAAWKAMRFQGDVQSGQVDLDALYAQADHAAAYAVAWLKSPADVRDAKIYCGSDDYLIIWVNGQRMHTYKAARRASNQDQDVVPGIHLKKGLNRVVVKCVDVVFAWDFYFRLTDAKGRPMVVKPAAQAK